jgi:hypothetical protein
MLRQFFLAVALSIVGLAALAQTEETSGNLVPLPGHSTANGLTVNQAYAVNQALSAAGAGVMINGFNYGYQYNLGNSWSQCTATNQDGSCSWTMTFNPRVDVNVSIRDNANVQIYGTTHIETGVNTGNRSRDFEYRFNDPRDILTLGNFNYSASTSNNSRIWGMYSQAVYTVNPCVSNPQSSPNCFGYKTYYNISDDSHAIVPIPFGFPFYGKLFTHSIFFDNGTVSFYTPNQEPQRWGAGNTGGSINGNVSSQFYYSIMPLWTDLINYNGSHYTQGDANYLRYTWENISQFGNPSSSNTFSLEIRPTGFVGIHYDQIDVSWATVGMIGNAALGEFATYNSQTSWSTNETIATDCSNPLNNVNCPGYQQAYFDQQCSANALYSPSCPGYAAAYFTQQCSINTLYDPACPGYATAYYDYQCSVSALYHTGCPGYANAYFDQQCSLDPLYNEACPSYATAYFDQQCSLDPLYNESCSGYDDAYYVQQCTADPLYDSGCTGYEVAYFDQQCTLNALYNSQCPGYEVAYFDQQCTLNALYNSQCPGYEVAYFNQQCSLSSLYNSQCPGYEVAYFNQQCTLDPLYNNQCPGYGQAYFDQQCTLDPLYNNQCPGYGQAYFDQQCTLDPLYNNQCVEYSEAFHLQQCTLDPLYSTTCLGYEVAYFDQQCSLSPLYNSQCPGFDLAYFDQQCSLNSLYDSQCPGYTVAYFNQQCSNNALYNNQCPGYGEAYAKKYILSAELVTVAVADTTKPVATSVAEPTKETTVVAVADAPAASASPADKTSPVQLTTAPASAPAETKKEAAPARTEARPAASATRQALAERRMAARAAATAAAAAEKANSGEMSSQMDSAASMEQQVELQNVVMGAMGFVAGFDAYGRAIIPDAAGYKPFVIYPGQRNIDTPASRRLLTGSDRLHQDMVDSQYNK